MSNQIQSLEEFCHEMEAWRKAIGMTEDDDWEMRNSGQRRVGEA